MTTGVIKLDSIDEAFDKSIITPRRNSDRSSSGVSSASNSPSGTPTVTSFSNPAADVLEQPGGYSNAALQLDPSELGSHNAPTRNVCTGVVSLRDELWLDIEAHLQPKPKPTALSATRTLAEKCRHFVQSKWRTVPPPSCSSESNLSSLGEGPEQHARVTDGKLLVVAQRGFFAPLMDAPSTSERQSIPLSMLPTKEVNGDQRPLSPRDKDEKDENANQTAAKSATTAAAAATAASQPSTSKAGAAPAKEAAPKDPDTVPPFSCTPVYVVILLAIFLVLVVGAITTIIDMRPELIYGRRANTTISPLNGTIPV